MLSYDDFPQDFYMTNRSFVSSLLTYSKKFSDGFFEFTFKRYEFDSVHNWYIDLFSETKDPNGARGRREEELIWVRRPVWEWYHPGRGSWEPAAGSRR